MYNETIIILGIICIVIITIVVLCITGYSFTNVKNYVQDEHFFSGIKKWINGGEDDEVKPYNTQILNSDTQINQNSKKIIDTTDILKNIKSSPNNNLVSSNKLASSNIATMSNKNAGPLDINKNHIIENKHTKDIKMNLQFFDADDEPNKNDYIYTGAEIGLTGANISCGNSKSKSIKAEGIAILDKDGSISNIKMIKNGKGYKVPPNVIISGGGGTGCKAKAIIDDNSTIPHIEILNGGSRYTSTPNIIIESPNYNKKCRLYTKIS